VSTECRLALNAFRQWIIVNAVTLAIVIAIAALLGFLALIPALGRLGGDKHGR
jgi:hypothetical protein